MRADLPHPDESLLGFLCRMADLNAYPSAASFLAGSGLRYGRRLIERIDEFEGLLALPRGALAAISPAVAPSVPALEWRFERFLRAPVCPQCIAEGKPHQQLWRHALATACPDHGVRLVDQCCRCPAPLTPADASFRACSCGFAYRDLICERAEPEELAVSGLLAGVGRGCSSPSTPFGVSPPKSVASFLFFLASNTGQARTGKDGKAPMPTSVADSREFLRTAARFLTDWPRRFDEHVGDRLRQAPRSNSAPQMLGRWYQRLMRFADEGYEPFRQRVAAVVAAEFVGTYGIGPTIRQEPRQWLSLAEAARLLAVRPERLREPHILEALGARRHTSGFGHMHFVCPRERILQCAQARSRFVDRRTVAELLGVTRAQMRLLEEAEFVVDVEPGRRPLLANGGFDLDSTEALVAALRDRAEPRDAASVEFRAVNLKRTSDRGKILRILRAIRDGELAPVQASGRLAEFRFAEVDLDRVAREVHPSDGYTAREISRLTGWKEQCVAHWCRVGLLSAETRLDRDRAQHRVSAASLATFQSTFIPASELATQVGTSAKGLLRALAERGIETVGDFPDGPARRGHLVRLADLTGAILSSPSAKVLKQASS